MLSGERNADKKRVAIIGNDPEALLLAVLFSEAKTPAYLVGPFEELNRRNPGNAWDEARWLLGLHRRNGNIIQLADPDEVPLSKVHDIIVNGHATSQHETEEMERVVRTVAKNLQKDSHFIFAGLCRPGYTLRIIGETIKKYSGMSIGTEVGLCYIPLLWNGEQLQTFREKPILIAPVGRTKEYHVQDLLLQIFPAITSTPKIEAAEAAGLFAPTYREVVSALELELANLCQNAGVDYAEAAELCKTSGLHSLGDPKTTPSRDAVASMIALSTIGTRSSRIIKAAGRVNEYAPAQVLSLIKNALALCGRRMRHSKIAILGLNGLRSVSETRPSPPQVLQTLRKRGATISLYPGENTTSLPIGYSQNVIVEKSIPKALQRANCAVIALDRPSPSELDPQLLASEMTHPAVICDLSRVLEASNVERAGLFYTSIGRGTPED